MEIDFLEGQSGTVIHRLDSTLLEVGGSSVGTGAGDNNNDTTAMLEEKALGSLEVYEADDVATLPP